MNNKILSENHIFLERIKFLKKESDYYPKILFQEYLDIHVEKRKVLFASTFLRIERNGIWYKIHFVESIILNKESDKVDLLLKIIGSVYSVGHLYEINSLSEVDDIQISEEQRLVKLVI